MADDEQPTEVAEDEEEQMEEQFGEEAEEAEEECSGEDYTPLGSSSEDAEKKRNYKDYKRLVREIKCQNNTIERIKNNIQEINCKPCITRCEEKDLKSLKECLQQEMLKLRTLVNKAMHLQNYGSRRRYKQINLITTFDEDQMAPISQTCDTLYTAKPGPERREHGVCWDNKIGDSSDYAASCRDESDNEKCADDSEDKQILQEIMAAIQTCKKKRNERKGPAKEKNQNNQCIQQLQQKIQCMQQTMQKLKEEIYSQNNNAQKKAPCSVHNEEQPPCKQGLGDMAVICRGTKTPKSEQFQKLKESYLHLLSEFSKKDEQIKDLTKKYAKYFINIFYLCNYLHFLFII